MVRRIIGAPRHVKDSPKYPSRYRKCLAFFTSQLFYIFCCLNVTTFLFLAWIILSTFLWEIKRYRYCKILVDFNIYYRNFNRFGQWIFHKSMVNQIRSFELEKFRIRKIHETFKIWCLLQCDNELNKSLLFHCFRLGYL